MTPNRHGLSDIYGRLLAQGTALIYSTFLGGAGNEYGIAADGAGNAYITGTTGSTNFPTVHPIQGKFGGYSDAFIGKIAP